LPLYDYECRACHQVTEVRHGAREAYDGKCPACGGDLGRVFNPAGIVFKGSGFYINDSRKGSGSSESAPASAPAPAPSGESKKSESSAA
jgi:putative FmdB family regulatory protein